jgi:hypothetical protein
MKGYLTILALLLSLPSFAENRPDHYDELVDYVQEAPDQAEAATCLYMGNTGAMELLANKKEGIKNPEPFGKYDLSESFLMWAPQASGAKSIFDAPVLKFNIGYGIPASEWPFEAWSENGVNHSVWDRHPRMNSLTRVPLPKVESIKLFQYGNKWSTGVLKQSNVEMVKDALWKYKSPVLINYNDNGYWHVILIVGYDDRLPGVCHDTNPKVCEGDIGSFYVRDSFSVRVELRDYDWFKAKGNAAFVIKLKD